jgi:AcrR family transcriptional regulator
VGAPRTPGSRAGLTRDAIVSAARELLTEDGLQGLSMRAVARRLDVAPNALYSHVDSKAALVDEVLDDILGALDEPEVTDPRAALRRLLMSTYDLLLQHPDLVPLYLARQGARGPNARRLGDVMTESLARGGVEGRRAVEALRVLIVHTIGFAAFATHPPVEPGAAGPLTAAELRANFETGLEWVLVGILG